MRPVVVDLVDAGLENDITRAKALAMAMAARPARRRSGRLMLQRERRKESAIGWFGSLSHEIPHQSDFHQQLGSCTLPTAPQTGTTPAPLLPEIGVFLDRTGVPHQAETVEQLECQPLPVGHARSPPRSGRAAYAQADRTSMFLAYARTIGTSGPVVTMRAAAMAGGAARGRAVCRPLAVIRRASITSAEAEPCS